MLDPARLRARILIAAGVIAGLGLAIEVAHAYSHAEAVDVLFPMLSLSFEANVPTWFSSSLLAACAVASGAIASARPPHYCHWWGASALAAYMSLDEAVELHEHLGGHIGTGGLLYYDWVIPAAAIVVVIALVYVPFVRALTAPTRARLSVAAAIYIGGALVMELPLGWWTEAHGTDTLGYGLIDWVEETLELVGASLALAALVQHRQEGMGQA